MFYIFDCNGHIVGNRRGYATHKGASNQANSTRTPAGRALWAARHAAGDASGGRIYAISTMETARAKGYAK